MAFAIQTNCTACGDCLTACPNQAIRASCDGPTPIHIEPVLCTECVGYSATPECVAVCLESAIKELDPIVLRTYWDAYMRDVEPLIQ